MYAVQTKDVVIILWFRPKGAGVPLYLSPEFMRKNHKPNQDNHPWYIPAVPTGKSDFGAPNYPGVKALRYYQRYYYRASRIKEDRTPSVCTSQGQQGPGRSSEQLLSPDGSVRL